MARFRTDCPDCGAHPDGECDVHFESFGVAGDAGDDPSTCPCGDEDCS